MEKFQSIILAFRPKTLTAAAIPCLAATALCASQNLKPNWFLFSMALLSAILIQIGTNLVNDAKDFEKGADNKERIGPQRITQAGVMSSRSVLFLASLVFLLAILAGIPLVLAGGKSILWIGVISVLMGYAYTAGPFPLAYVGLGDLFVIIFFGVIAVMGMFFLHTGVWSLDAFVLGLQIGFHATVLIAINNFRDMNTDKLVNKKTLAVRFGSQFTRYEIAVLCILPFVLNIYWLVNNKFGPILMTLFALPIALIVIRNIFTHDPSEKFNKFLAQSAVLHALFGILISIGFQL